MRTFCEVCLSDLLKGTCAVFCHLLPFLNTLLLLLMGVFPYFTALLLDPWIPEIRKGESGWVSEK